MAITVTATQGGSTANGFALRVFVLTGAKPVASQTGNSNSTQFSSVSSFTASITNSAGSSIYMASSRSGAATAASGSSMTIVDDINDAAANGEWYTTGHVTGLSSGTTTRGYTQVGTVSGPFVMLEILAAGTLAEDASGTGLTANTSGAGPVSVGPFTPPPGSLLVALIGSDGGAGSTTFTMSNSGTALNWTEKVKNNPSAGDYAGVWIADVPAASSSPAELIPPGLQSPMAFGLHFPPQPVQQAPAVTPSATGPVFEQATQPVQAKLPRPVLAGRVGSNDGGPVLNPVRGPVFEQATSPAQARFPLPVRGRVASNDGGPVANPAPSGTGPVFRPVTRIRPQQPLPRRGVCRAIRFGPLPVNPVQGPVFRQSPVALRAKIPFPPPRGRTGFSQTSQAVPVPNVVAVTGAMPGSIRAALPAHNRGRVRFTLIQPLVPSVTGPAFFPFRQAVRGRLPLPLRGRTYGNPGGPLRNPVQGPQFRPFRFPVQATDPLPKRGRAYGNPGGPVQNPVPPVFGPVFAQKPYPARIRPSLPPKGRDYGNAGGPVRNPVAGPVFRQLNHPVQARFPLPPKGRDYGNPGGPVQNPVPPVIGPVFFPLRQAVHVRFTLPQRGRSYGNQGAPVRNPSQGPVFRQLNHPVQQRIPQTWSKGRVYSGPGGPVRNPVFTAPFFPAPQAIRARLPLPSRGRTYSNQGIPVPRVAPFRQLNHPVQARIPLPPRGRIASGRGAPLRNPVTGPRFRQATAPIRARIPQNAPRGRTGFNPGGPVQNIPLSRAVFSLGLPFTGWGTGSPFTGWGTGLVFTGWGTGDPFTQWETGLPFIDYQADQVSA